MIDLKTQVILYGQVNQQELAEIFNRCSIIALTSFYEGLPLVLIEALACGCQIVCTKLPGIANELIPIAGDFIETVELPSMKTIDIPEHKELPQFAQNIATAITRAIAKPKLKSRNNGDTRLQSSLKHFTWQKVFKRIEKVWLELLENI